MAVIKGITIEIDGNTTGLQEALKDVNKEISGVNGELKSVDRLLKLDPTNTDLLAQRQQLLQKAIADTSSKLSQLKDAKKQADDQLEKGTITEEQYRQLTREIAKTEISLKGLEGQIKETDNASSKLDFKSMGASLSNLGGIAGNVAANIGKVVAVMGAALGAAVAFTAKKLFDGAVAAGQFADELLATAQKTNLSTDTLQKWDYAAKFIDTDIEVMTSSMRKMTKTLGTNEEAFTKLGIATRDSSGNFRSQEDVFNDSIDALGRVENATQRDILAQQLFGKSAAELNPLIAAGGAELKRLGDEAIASGAVISGPVLQQFAAFDDTMERLKTQFGALGKNIVGNLMPAIMGLAGPIQDAVGKINLILSDGLQAGDMDQISTIVGNLVTNLGTKLAEMLPKLIDFIVPAITSLVSVIVGIMPTLIPALLNGVMSIITGIATAVSKNVKPLTEMVKTLLANIATFLAQNVGTILQAAFDLLTALVDGILQSLPIVIPALIDVVLGIVDFLLSNIDKIIQMGIDLLLALIEGIVNAIPVLVEKMPLIIEKIVSTLIKLTPMLLGAAIEIIIALALGLVKAIPELIKAIPKVIGAIVDGLGEAFGQMLSIGKDIVSGLWEGIKNSFGWIKDKITGWVGDIMKFIKKLFGIASPSKVMKKDVGLNLGLGVAAGIEDSLGAVNGAMSKLNNEVTASVNPIINPTANSNPLILQIENFINERGTDIQKLMEEAEFLRRNAALAGGIK